MSLTPWSWSNRPIRSSAWLELVGHVRIELDARLEPPEQVGREGEIALLGPMVAFAPDALVDPEYLLDDDDRRPGRSLRLGDIGVEAAVAFQRVDPDRPHVGSSLSRAALLYT